MKNFLILFLILLATASVAYSQVTPFPGAPISGNGPPTGSCNPGVLYTDNLTGNVYTCTAGSYVLTDCKLGNVFTVGVSCASVWGGGDIGAQINAAYTALPNPGCTSWPMTGACGGTIYVPAGFYSFSTPISFSTLNKSIKLSGAGGLATILNYTGSSGVAITINNGEGTTGGNLVQDLMLQGPNSGSSTALVLGGTQGDLSTVVSRTAIYRFPTGIVLAGLAYGTRLDHDVIQQSGVCLSYPGGNGTQENIVISQTFFGANGGSLSTNNNCPVNLTGAAEISFEDDSFDGSVVTVSNPGAGNSSDVLFHKCHFESASGSLSASSAFLIINGQNVSVKNSFFINDNFAPPTAFIDINATSAPAPLVDVQSNEFWNSNTTPLATLTFRGNQQPTLYICCTLNPSGGVTSLVDTTSPAGRLAIYADAFNGASQLSPLNGTFFAPSLGPVQTGAIWDTGAAPSIASGFNTSGYAISGNGTGSFFVTVGTGTPTSTGVITMPSGASNGWNCFATNQNRAAQIQQTANGATSVTLTNYGTTFTATNWTNGDFILVTCRAR
jgi:hypothetical protein